ncbi:beta-N-acetylhexosaminidase [Lachnotalea glycerini]|uniref:beta-N-acetylhexosaminidase n=1 Tax=Lachnotalea glycerini TaxID=1763509 RepID=A0A318ET89_9FIRM|nr:glycoside hydrolase family 3 protein [Lachnotalea glycerini]PXV86899.1 beta-N-acetylhexosaminidase [Lachnotalea glycerini]
MILKKTSVKWTVATLIITFLLAGCFSPLSQKNTSDVEKSKSVSEQTQNESDGVSSQTENASSNDQPKTEAETNALSTNETEILQDFNNSTQSASSSVSTTQTMEQQVKQKLSEMTLEEKVAQIFVITPEALTGYQTVTAAGDVTRNALKNYPVGGLVYFSPNIETPEQLKAMTENTQKYAKEIEGMPLFLSIDEEGGTIARIGNNTNFQVKRFSDMASIGATNELEKAYEVGDTIGGYLKQYGLNLDFAPDADVLTNPDNTVIENRSFGSDGNAVAKMDLEVAKGLDNHQVLSCFKHFPGHGATQGDTHEGFTYTNKTLDELKESELVPFQAAIDNDIPFIMISHISVPNVIGDNTPSSLSKVMITDILRGEMGYQGIIITDSMSMGAIVNNYGSTDAVIQSIQAGADLILMPKDFKAAYQGVLDAVNDKTISEQRINESLERILRVKLEMSY